MSLSKFRTDEKKIGIRNKVALAGLIAVMVVVDQVTKWWATTTVKGNTMVIIKGVLSFDYTTNDGVAFGLFGGWSFVVIGLTSVIVLGAIIFLFSDFLFKSKVLYISGALIVSGGIGNLIDRFLKGEVVDFIRVTFINFPTFNVADICVVIGSLLLVVAVMFIIPASEDEKPVLSVQKEDVEEVAENDD